MESRHAKELSVFQTQLACYKKTVEALKLELVNHAESQKLAQSEAHLYKSKLDELRFEAENERRMQSLHFQKEKELLNEQIKLHKIQLEEITSKHIATMSILESKESIERSLEQALSNAAALKQENDTLKYKLDDLSCRYSAAQSMIENSQVHEKTLSGKIYELERSLSRFDATSVSTVSELGETIYKTFDDEVLQNQLIKRKFEDRLEMEGLLVEKIHILEEDLNKANDKLEQTDLAKKTYEKQLKDMKNTCDKLQQEVNSLKEINRATSHDDSTQEYFESDILANIESARRTEVQHREIENLKLLMEQKETENTKCKKDLTEMTEKMKKLEAQCEQLRDGLVHAWTQCAEFEEKLNQTAVMSDSSKVNTSLNSTTSSKHLKANQSLDDSASDQNIMDLSKESDIAGVSTLADNSNVKNSENLHKEVQQILEGELNIEEIKFKLCRYYTLCEKIAAGKGQLSTENAAFQMEKELLNQEIQDMMNRCKEELESVKADSAKEINRLRSLVQNFKSFQASLFILFIFFLFPFGEFLAMFVFILLYVVFTTIFFFLIVSFLSLKDGNDINKMKAELNTRHAKEMEELRTYFEQKCLQMEKQYSEEIFSQQSKRISDNDSETEELTDDLYFGGAGDCLNTSNSRAATSDVNEESLKDKILEAENQARLETEYENNIQTLRQELERKMKEIQIIKADHEKAIEEQKELYECQIRDIEAKLERSLAISAVHQVKKNFFYYYKTLLD